MAEIFSLPASTSLLAEINVVGEPGRLKAQDGTIGDRAHMQRPSDHNLDEIGNTGSSSDSDTTPEVHARDVDARGPWRPGWSMARIVGIVLARCRSGVEKRLKYIIYAGYIYSASNEWKKVKYDGDDQHHEHAHFSFRYGSGSGTSNPENITSSWGIRDAYEAEQAVSLDKDDKSYLEGPFAKSLLAGVAGDVVPRWTQDGGPVDAKDPNPTMSVAYTLYYLGAQIAQIKKNVNALTVAVTGIDVVDAADRTAIAGQVLEGLRADEIAELIVTKLPADLAADVARETLKRQGVALTEAADGITPNGQGKS